MKTIYTSNYARKGADLMAIAISAWPPKWYVGKMRLDLAPTREMVLDINAGRTSWDDYVDSYTKLLEKRIDPHNLIEELPDGCFLLCYESPTDLCHRQVLASWVELKTGFKMIEWKNEKEALEAQQQGLVESLLDL